MKKISIILLFLICLISISYKPATEIIVSEQVIINNVGKGTISVLIQKHDIIVEILVDVIIDCDSLKRNLKRI